MEPMNDQLRHQSAERRLTAKTQRTQRKANFMDIEVIGQKIIGAAIKVHSTLGPGLLESAYQKCLKYELRQQGMRVQCELSLPIRYADMDIDAGYRIDMLVEGQIVIENKTVEKLLPIHEAQLLTYLKMTGCRLGYILNWNVPMIRDGIKRMVHRLPVDRSHPESRADQ